jgi:hypothetical protein
VSKQNVGLEPAEQPVQVPAAEAVGDDQLVEMLVDGPAAMGFS